jgi:methyl-accepting chemotaxis protein
LAPDCRWHSRVTALLGVLLSILAARGVTGPLSELAAAAEQLGGSGDAPPLTPGGPQEVQRTIKAFNRMQERLRRFDCPAIPRVWLSVS